MTLPTASELQARYPAFASVATAYIDAVIAEASRFVDPAVWFEADVKTGTMALAAHMMASDGALGGKPGTSGVITSDKLGDASQSFGSVEGQGEYGTTSYGRAFLRLLRVNAPGVAST